MLAELLTAVGTFATAIGVFLTWQQLRGSKQLAKTQFEDRLVEQYRAIIADLPVEALLGEALESDVQRKLLGVFYRYIDLCNEQAFLHLQGRITDETWQFWKDGIASHMRLPAFQTAWAAIRERAPESFSDFKQIEGIASQLALSPPKI